MSKKVFIVDWDTCEYQTISAIIVADNKQEAKDIAKRDCHIPNTIRNEDINVMEVPTNGESQFITRFVE